MLGSHIQDLPHVGPLGIRRLNSAPLLGQVHRSVLKEIDLYLRLPSKALNMAG